MNSMIRSAASPPWPISYIVRGPRRCSSHRDSGERSLALLTNTSLSLGCDVDSFWNSALGHITSWYAPSPPIHLSDPETKSGLLELSRRQIKIHSHPTN